MINIELAVLPNLVRDPERQVCLVVDILRATTTLVAFLEQGVREVYLGVDPEDVRAIAAQMGDCLLAGERGGLAPEGFDYSNSPAQVLAAPAESLRGRRLAFCTTNGTKALRRLMEAGAPLVLAASTRNARAVTAAALAYAAANGCDITVVASGRGRGNNLSLDDLIVGGYLIYLLREGAGLTSATQARTATLTDLSEDDPDYARFAEADSRPTSVGEASAEVMQRNAGAAFPFVPFNAAQGSGWGEPGPRRAGEGGGSGEVRMAEEGATIALRLYLSYIAPQENPAQPGRDTFLTAFNETSSGTHLLRFGWAADCLAAATANVSTAVPMVQVERGLLVVRPMLGGATIWHREGADHMGLPLPVALKCVRGRFRWPGARPSTVHRA